MTRSPRRWGPWILAALVPTLAALLFRAPVVAGASAASEITVLEVRCYVVCDSLHATFGETNQVIRRERGAVLGKGRVPVDVTGDDTVIADTVAFAALRRALTRYPTMLPTTFVQGKLPCSFGRTTHTPDVTIQWRQSGASRTISYDFGCHELGGQVFGMVLHATRAARLGSRPIKRR